MKKLLVIVFGMVILMASFGHAAEEAAPAPATAPQETQAATPPPQQAPAAAPAPAAPPPAPAPAPPPPPAPPAPPPAQTPAAVPAPPVAGSETIVIGVTVTELTNVVNGWSVKKKVLDQRIYNDTKQKIGKVDDIIIGPDRAVNYAIIGTGGFLGLDRHDVAIPIKQFKVENGKFILPGATKEALKKMPPFKYAK
jgi:hypothetical protein